MFLVAGVLAGMLKASRSGLGQVVDAAMCDGASLLMSMIWAYRAKGLWLDQREANLFDGGSPLYGTYRCADGLWVSLGCIERRFWEDLLDRAGVTDPELRLGAGRPRQMAGVAGAARRVVRDA